MSYPRYCSHGKSMDEECYKCEILLIELAVKTAERNIEKNKARMAELKILIDKTDNE